MSKQSRSQAQTFRALASDEISEHSVFVHFDGASKVFDHVRGIRYEYIANFISCSSFFPNTGLSEADVHGYVFCGKKKFIHPVSLTFSSRSVPCMITTKVYDDKSRDSLHPSMNAFVGISLHEDARLQSSLVMDHS